MASTHIPMPSIHKNPFTPHPGEEPLITRGRDQELSLFHDIINKSSSLRGVLDHIVLLGEWGLGKTVLLKQFKALAQSQGYPTFLCGISKFPDNADVNSGLELLIGLILRQSPKAAQIVAKLKDFDITLKLPGLSGKTSKKHTHPQINLTTFLQTMWGFLKSELAIVLIDDVQNFSSISFVLDVIRAVLNEDDIRNNTNWLFVLSCLPRKWDEYLHKHDPIGRTFRVRRTLEKLNNNQVSEVVLGSLEGTGVSFDKILIDRIYEVTYGHPYELQTLCDNLYINQIKGHVDPSFWEISLEQTLDQLGEAFFNAACNDVSDREIPVLRVLAESRSPMTIKDIQKKLKSYKNLSFPTRDTKTYIYRLVKERRLVEKLKRGLYHVPDKMLCEFVSRRLPIP